jgi:hypothetical protein
LAADRTTRPVHPGRPGKLTATATVWYLPSTSKFLAEPGATEHSVTIAWYAVTSAALALTGVAMRDQWHR